MMNKAHSKKMQFLNGEKIMNRVFIAIDMANMNGALYIIGKKIGEKLQFDFIKAIDSVAIGSEVIEKNVYLGLNEDEGNTKFRYFLEKSGFNLITKEIKEIIANDGSTKLKANFDVEIAVDICRAFWTRCCDEIILFSGDSDFAYLIDKIKKQGIKITIVSSEDTISKELRDRADRIIMLDDIINQIKK